MRTYREPPGARALQSPRLPLHSRILPMPLQLYRSNSMERLADALADAVRQPLSNVLAPEHIAVPSAGMERWLALELSSRLGVWANPAFPFPGKLVESLLTALLDESTLDPEAFAPRRTQFAIARLIAELAGQAEFQAVRTYLEQEASIGRRLVLAARIADVFDHYVTYRPELVLAWQRGRESHWQAELFRALGVQMAAPHMAARVQSAQRALEAGRGAVERIPERLHVFGVSTLPPQYLQLLAAVAEHREVHVYVLSPSREYFGDLRSERERSRALRRAPESDAPQARDPFESHALLASLGRHSREFQELIEALPYAEREIDLYRDPGEDTLLHALQSDMLWLRDRTGNTAERKQLEPADDSLAIHACHGPMRELEVLHDQLLALISDRGVEPHQIIVLTPDIASYAPVIEAVFAQSEGRTRIPFRVADRSARSSYAVLSAFDALLAVFESRFAASQVLDLLGQDPIRERFELAMDEVEQLREWVDDSGIRWGVDAEHRAEVGQPRRDENTWRFGLSRLMLGYASGNPPGRLFAGCAPAEVDSGDADLLGRFHAFCKLLFAFRLELKQAVNLAGWRERLTRVLAAFIEESRDNAAEHATLREALLGLEQDAQRAGFDEAIELADVRRLLAGALEARPAMHGFLSGGVTFCQLVPMRSIPFRVVCVLGLNDGAFPAIDTPLDFDLMAAKRQPGDRSRRDDDRELFLEALLSARDKLILSYVGQSIHDGQPRLPSVLVTELIDHVARSFALPEQLGSATPASVSAMEARLTTRHPLAAASPRYFAPDRDRRLFSYATSALDGARAVCGPRVRPEPFCALDPNRVMGPPAAINLRELEEGLVRPLRLFSRQKLGLSLGRDVSILGDREPFELDALERWQLGTDLLTQRLEPSRPEPAPLDWDAYERERARGRLPLGTPGKLAYRALDDQVAAIVTAFDAEAGGGRMAPVEVGLQFLGTRITGRLEQLWPSAQLRVQYSSTGGRHELQLFIRHVVMCYLRAQHPELGLPERSVLIGRNNREAEQITLVAPADAREVLRELLDVYAAVIAGPIPLFEHSSREYATQIKQGKSEIQAENAARSKFSKLYDSGVCDSDDAYVSQFFPDFDTVLAVPKPYSFRELATRVYLPLLACRRDD
ncbi:MAG TPA: exodeoxyribonuclease V subunit gamma [Polyangiales bacterium]|nr:exodeoxyribonuclease V subunit gamma [Polyangiales bacterium]